MDWVEEIEAAIISLPPEEFQRILGWLRELEQTRWDEQLNRHSSEGKLDFVFNEGEGESAQGLVREWPPRT